MSVPEESSTWVRTKLSLLVSIRWVTDPRARSAAG